MTQTFSNLIGKIKTKLEGLEDVATEPIFHTVYDYAEGKFDGYPVAVIIDKGGSGIPIDTQRIERDFVFDVVLYQEQSLAGKTPAEAAVIMRTAVDRVMAAFDEDLQLGGEVMRVLVAEIEVNFTARPGTFEFARFTLHIKDFVNNYS